MECQFFNVLCYWSDVSWEAAAGAAGLPCADARRSVVAEVVSRAPLMEQSMGWVVLLRMLWPFLLQCSV